MSRERLRTKFYGLDAAFVVSNPNEAVKSRWLHPLKVRRLERVRRPGRESESLLIDFRLDFCNGLCFRATFHSTIPGFQVGLWMIGKMFTCNFVVGIHTYSYQ